MTKKEAVILSAYTGYLLVPDFGDVHEFIEKLLGRPVWTHQLADPAIQGEIREKCKPLLPVATEEPRWIPVTERLPEKSDYYLAVPYNRCIGVIHYSASHQVFNAFDNTRNIMEIPCTHWMPLPELPKEVE